jgi:hypothetical protein
VRQNTADVRWRTVMSSAPRRASCKAAIVQLWKEHGKLLSTAETKRLLGEEFMPDTIQNNYKLARASYSAEKKGTGTGAGSSASNSRKRARVTVGQHNIAMPLPTYTKAFDLGGFGTVLAQAAPATVRWQEEAAAARQRVIQQGEPTPLLLGDAFRLPNSLWKGYDHGSSPCVLDGFVEKFAWDDGAGPAYIVRTVEDGWHYPFPPDKLAEHAAVTPPAMPSSSSTADVEVEVEADPWEEEVLEPGDAWVAFDCAAVAAAEQRRRQQGQEEGSPRLGEPVCNQCNARHRDGAGRSKFVYKIRDRSTSFFFALCGLMSPRRVGWHVQYAARRDRAWRVSCRLYACKRRGNRARASLRLASRLSPGWLYRGLTAN